MSIWSTLTDWPDTNRNEQLVDFDRRYTNTYMYLTDDKGVRQPIYIKRTRGDSLVLMDAQMKDFVLPLERIQNIEVCMPKTGYYNIQGHVSYLSKSPTRQWKRSLNNGLFSLASPAKNIGYRSENWFGLMEEADDPEYVNINYVNHPYFTNIAISRLFAIVNSKKENFLVYRRCVIGKVDSTKKVITLNHKILEQEVRDLLKRQGAFEWQLQVT